MRNGKIEHMTLEQIMGDRFGRYSKSIIQERALPDIRDGLKPVQRRILFAMNKDGNTYDKGFRKSAKSVGNVMGNFHPHGDSSIYEALVRLSQDWKLRLAERRVTTLMGNKVEPRREWIEENVQFTLADDQESDQLVENKGQLPPTKEPTISTWNK